jgi:hypothetical protein
MFEVLFLFLNEAIVLEDGGWKQLFSVGTLRNVKAVEVAKVKAIAAHLVYYLRQQNELL